MFGSSSKNFELYEERKNGRWWLGGKISANEINEISSILLSLNDYTTSEFSQQPRSLEDLDRWKVTDFWQLLLNTVPIVLQDIISDNAYEHFLALSITLTILLQSDDTIRCQYFDYAQDLIRHFVYNSKYVYGNTFTCIIYITCYIYQMTVFTKEAHLTQFPAFSLKIFCSDLKSQC